MKFRSTASVLTLALAMSLSTLGHAQNISDSDRKGARDLYERGASLQVQGKPADALDAFMRSYNVFPAPTTALHIAQCQAALGHLVEAEEDYRALANAQIPAGSAQAFYTAQEQAKAELAQISPRLPTIRITTTPDKIANLQLKIDDQIVNASLVGVPRAVNPGTHKVVAMAPGYSNAEQTVTVQEKDARDVPLTLARGAGPTPVGNTTTYQPTRTANPQQTQPYQDQTTWNAPYSQPTRRSNGALWGGGIALVILGSIATLAGVGMIVAGSSSSRSCDFTGRCTVTSSDPGLITGGGVTTTLGLAAIVGGAIMVAVGGKRIPVAADAAWMPIVRVGPTGGDLTWKF